MVSSLSSVAFFWCLHAGFVIVSFVGAILFLVWAMRLKQDQLKKWVLWLLVVGTIGGLLTAQFSFMGWGMMNGKFENFKQGMMNFDNK